MEQFLNFKNYFFHIYGRYPYANISVLDLNISCLILTLMGLNECYVMRF